MGFGSSSGNQSTTTQVLLDPAQRRILDAQTQFLTETAFPAYKATVGTAGDVYNQVSPQVNQVAQNAIQTAQQASEAQKLAGIGGLATGMSGLASLFNPQYEEQQVQGALQTGREELRNQLAGQNAMYGGAGGLGSARAMLADKNLQQLGEQRQATAAAAARAGVQANKAAAANQLATFGLQGLTGAQQAAGSQIGYAQSPQDAYSKYASIVYGIPQGNTTPNFAGTQGSTQTSSGSSKGFRT